MVRFGDVYSWTENPNFAYLTRLTKYYTRFIDIGLKLLDSISIFYLYMNRKNTTNNGKHDFSRCFPA